MSFSREKHIRFWRMNATLLPTHYMSNDSSRMTLGFFIVAALDLLDALDTIQSDERQSWIDWIYSCQCPEGGFRGFTGTDLDSQRTESNRAWDPANVPATFFALATLIVLGDDMLRVHRRECLQWLPRVQRNDGSFGEMLGENNSIEGGRDLRYCCCAAGIIFMLQGSDSSDTRGIDLIALEKYIQSCQNYNGGFGESPLREPHSGLTYCAIASLAFVQKLQSGSVVAKAVKTQEALRWIIDRQTDVLEERDEDEDEEETGAEDPSSSERENRGNTTMIPDALTHLGPAAGVPSIAGFNGREGKIADTCYCFWNTGALAILGYSDLIEEKAMESYLLDRVQHMIGGFGKGIGAPPDVMHSYLGLAALAVTSFKGLKSIDPGLCISQESASRLRHITWR